MKAPTTLLGRPGRVAAVTGAVVAVGAATLMALGAGPAAASEPGRCTANVNVRAEPEASSRIVALCEAGTEVQVGDTRNGYVQLTDLGGWAAQQYVAVDGAPPAAPAEQAPATTPPAPDPTAGTPAPTSAPAGGNRGADGIGGSRTADAPAARTFPRPSTSPAPALLPSGLLG